eukprot:2595565-Ditylum_brightwellii.AAC.1
MPKTIDHFHLYPGNKEQWEDFATSLCYFYNKNTINPGIRILLQMALTASNLCTAMRDHPNIPWPDYQDIIHTQGTLGCEQM